MNLELYHRWGCPYSAKVRAFISENELQNRFKMVEVDEVDGAIERLMALNYQAKVPCLIIDGRPLLESTDIINWIDQNVLGPSEQANA